MLVLRLTLDDFRSYERATIELGTGLTVVCGANGQGKTNLVEAMAFVASLASFRGAPTDALVRVGATQAVLRAELDIEGREVLVEIEITSGGRTRAMVNRQRVARSRDLTELVRVTVFSPDDLELVKGGPAERRLVLDELLSALSRRDDQVRSDVDRVLRQRNALLKQVGGRLDADAAFTLDVWDAKFAEAGEALGRARQRLVASLEPLVAKAYDALVGNGVPVVLSYEPTWLELGLAAALAASRADDVRRGVSLVGPHRDELLIMLDGLPSRTHASQGEQRSLALALRLGGHELVTGRTGTPPLLILDDVLSELDPGRSRALLEHVPAGQVLLTTAGPLPEGAVPDHVVVATKGSLR